ncbi:MAG: dUTP diphosphatase, partial [Janthinobacterium lividum]
SIGIRLGNTVGFIDPDYQGAIAVGVESRLRRGTVRIERGERICQMYFGPIERAEWKEVAEFSTVTARGKGAYGSTGRV